MRFNDQGADSERLAGVWRQHPLVLWGRVAPGIAISAILLIAGVRLFGPVGLIFPAITLVWVLGATLDWFNRTVEFRPLGVVIREGLIGRREQLVQMHLIKSVDIQQPLLCRLSNAGHIRLIIGPDSDYRDIEFQWLHPIDRFSRAFNILRTRSQPRPAEPIDVVVRQLPPEQPGRSRLPAPNEEEPAEEANSTEVIDAPYREVSRPAPQRRRRLRR